MTEAIEIEESVAGKLLIPIKIQQYIGDRNGEIDEILDDKIIDGLLL